MKDLSLYELLDACGIRYDRASVPDRDVKEVTCDSRRARKDAVFVAIRGTREDGNRYAPQALKAGAFLITDAAPASADPRRTLRVPDARRAFALLNHAAAGRPSEGLILAGITGTNGKTTSAYLLRSVLERRTPTGLIGTVEYRFRDRAEPASHTTPGADKLHRILKDMRANGCGAVVMEASSHALDQERLAALGLDAALVTNITRDHLDYHADHAAYRAAKGKLFDLLKPGGAAVLNADDPSFEFFRPRLKRVISYGLDRPAALRAVNVRSSLSGSHFDLEWEGKAHPFETPLIGRHNVYNVTGAVAMALGLGFDLSVCRDALRGFGGVPGRLERVDAGQDFAVFVDYAHTDDGLLNVLRALKPFVSGRLLLAFGCGGDRDRAKRPAMARIAREYADFIVLTSDNPRHENENAILDEIAAGFGPDFKGYERQRDRKKAIKRILMTAGPGDVVLLAGKGHEDYQVIGDKKLPFSDREEALRVLGGL